MSVQAFEFKTQHVTNNVYALVGETGARTTENFGSNNTVGFIITSKGVVLVGTGAMPAGAKLIEEAIKKVTSQPIKWVINIGSQDHHWLGNSYFINKGIPVIALERTVNSQKEHVDDHLVRLKTTAHDQIKTVNPKYATKVIKGDRYKFNLGGNAFELYWPGNGHFSGDAVLWIENSKTVFTGDFVFLDRMLGIHPFSSVTQWQQSLVTLNELNAQYVVPGHGHAASWDKAKIQTIDYLNFLISGVKASQDDWLELDEAIEKIYKAPKFENLLNFDSWHRRNIHRTYMQLEAAQ